MLPRYNAARHGTGGCSFSATHRNHETTDDDLIPWTWYIPNVYKHLTYLSVYVPTYLWIMTYLYNITCRSFVCRTKSYSRPGPRWVARGGTVGRLFFCGTPGCFVRGKRAENDIKYKRTRHTHKLIRSMVTYLIATRFCFSYPV